MKSKKFPLILLLPALSFLLFALLWCFGDFSSQIKLERLTLSDRGTERTVASPRDLQVDLNKAELEDLLSIPGIGQSLGEKILAYRGEHGDFQKLEDLEQIPGIGEKTVEALRDYLYVED